MIICNICYRLYYALHKPCCILIILKLKLLHDLLSDLVYINFISYYVAYLRDLWSYHLHFLLSE